MAAPVRHGPGNRGAMMRAPIERPRDAKKTILRLFSYLKEDGHRLALVVICILAQAASNLAGAALLRPIINGLAQGRLTPWSLMSQMARIAIIYLVGILTMYFQSKLMLDTGQKAVKRIRSELYAKVEGLPVSYFDRNAHGDIMSRFTNDVDAVGQMLNSTMVQVISGVISIIGTLALMIYTNWVLCLVTVVMVPLMMKSAGFVAKRSRKYYKQQQDALGALNGYIEEAVTGQKVIKVFTHEERAIADFDSYNRGLREKQVGAQFFGGIMGPIMNGSGQINYTMTSVIGGLMCVLDGFDVGGMTVFVNYSRQFSRPINEISMQVNILFSALAGAERVFGIMDEVPEEPTAANAPVIIQEEGRCCWDLSATGDKYSNLKERGDGSPESLKKLPFRAEIVVQGVDFGYVPEKKVLQNITLYAKPGQKIAFVGSTGAGKTTITNLINRFYDVNAGSITIDTVDVREIDRASLRRNVAMVLQDTHLFRGTVKENIRYGRLDATDEEVVQAAKTASAHDFITQLPKGYDTVLEGDGANLSQGQRQLLNIARAAISKAPILILDEATSSVDTRTEKQIERGMDRLMEERTTLVIAHRLSTVRSANAIMVLENGRIIERGDHSDLLSQKGRYYELYTGLKELE